MKMKKGRTVRRAFLVNLIGVLTSRILGFVRDAIQAAVLGASVYSDILTVAFKFPNTFRRIFGEGAFVQTFLPYFLKSRKRGAWCVVILGSFCMVLFIMSLLVMLLAQPITRFLALGYGQECISMATPLVMINFWYLLPIFVVTYLSSLLQYKNIFWVGAYNTVLLNTSMIAAFVICRGGSALEIAHSVSYSVLIGGVAQVLIHAYPLHRSGMLKIQIVGLKSIVVWKKQVRESNSKKATQNLKELTQDVVEFFKSFMPAMLGASTAQIAALLDSSLVTLLPDSDGGVSILNYANRIFQLPLALFAIAISTALFPTIAKSIKLGNIQKATNSMKNAFWFLVIILSAVTLGCIMLSTEIVWLVFERHSFKRNDTMEVSLALTGYIVGLIPFGLARIVSLWLYSEHKQALAAKISVVSIVSGLVLSLILMWEYRYFGIALASSISGYILLALSIKSFGLKRFLYIVKSWRYPVLLVTLITVEYALIESLKPMLAVQ